MATITRLFTKTATVATPGATTVDAEGVPATTMATTTVLNHTQPYTAKADEQVLGQELAQRAIRAWFPVGTTITARSIVTLAGEAYEVHGDPKVWDVGSPEDHVAVILVRVQR